MDYKAFVSSTFVDLEHHRERVIDELQKSGFFVDPMEQWASAAQAPKVVSTRRLDDCKLCVLLVGRRRGHVPEGDTLSITQQEVVAAKERGIDILTFLLDDGVPEADWPWDATDRPAVEAWRKDLREHCIISKFKVDPATIELGPALTRWVKEKGAEVALDLYLKLVEQEHGTIQFVGLPQLKDNPNVPIKRLYVEPALADRQVSPDTDPKEWPKTTPVLDVMARYSRLVVLGDPGSGKSTLVNWVTWQLAKHHHSGSSQWTERLDRRVPLPFILRNLGIGPGVTWETLLRAFLDQPIAKLLDMADLHRILEEGQAIIMLDGLDEIGNPVARDDLRFAVWDAWEKYRKCRWLLTSRIVGYDEVAFDHGIGVYPYKRPEDVDYAELRHVSPFDDARVEQFADNWFMLRENSESTWRRLAKELIEAVRADDSTTKLGRIPNLLTMMALIYRIEAQLPHGRARLYAKITQAYLETIDKWRRLQRTTEEWPDRRRWLARVGFEMQRRRTAKDQDDGTKKEILATGEDVRGWIAAEMAVSGKTVGDHDAEEFVEYLAKRSGLLLPRGEDQFAFLHLSFQEYFAASFLMEQVVSPDWKDGGTEGIATGATSNDVGHYANDSIWRETLVFLVELMAVEQPKWLKTLRAGLFGVDLAEISGRSAALVLRKESRAGGLAVRNQNRVVLLARLVIDPQAGFDSMERDRAIRACCRWEMAAQELTEGEPWYYSNSVAKTLFTADKDERLAITEIFVEAAQELGIIHLNLSRTGVSDLSPLSGLSGLTTLLLSGTNVNELAPLSGLSGLTTLFLSGTNVSELAPLSGLSGLTTLHLSDTNVSELAPLSGLSGLTELNLGRTNVSVLSPLAGLNGLITLHLNSTKVSDLSPLSGLKNLLTIILGKEQQVTIPPSLKEIISRPGNPWETP